METQSCVEGAQARYFPGDNCSRVLEINRSSEIVGYSGSWPCPGKTHAVLWEHQHITDLNAEIVQSPLLLVEADSINDSGKIVGVGMLPNGDWRAYLLIPCKGRELPAPDCQKPARGTKGIPQLTQAEASRFDSLRVGSKPVFSWPRFGPRLGPSR